MSNKKFTSDEINALKANPYVRNVSEKSITYTKEFKERFYHDYLNGESPTSIFRKYGFDTTILGRNRIFSFQKRIQKESLRPEGFTDTRKGNSGRPSEKNLTEKEIIEHLRYKNNVLQQENDFLKRVRSINRQQILKQRKKEQPKKSSN